MLRRIFQFLVVILCLLAPVLVLADEHDPKRVMAAEVMERLNAGETIVFLDTRTSVDWAAAKSKIPNAIRVSDNGVLSKIVEETPKDSLIVTYCT